MASAVTQTPPPPSEVPQQDTMLNVLAWLEIHRRQLLAGFVALIAVFGAVYLWRHFAAEREAAGNAALLALRQRQDQPDSGPTAADFLKVAEQHASTSAGLRARLLAAGAFFSESRYSEAQIEFEKVLAAAPSGVLAAQAAYGVAASLDAQDKLDQAIAKYQDLTTQFADDSVASQARLALARIHEGRQQPESALRLLDELLRERDAGPISQQAAEIREELLRKNPRLNATNAPAASTTAPPAAVAP